MSLSKVDRSFAIAASAAVILAIVGGFWVLGTPWRQRQLTLDQQRIQGLVGIASILHDQAMRADQKYVLPVSLDQGTRKTDPVTNKPYEYRRLSPITYELCAEFATNSRQNPPAEKASKIWQHPQGRHCFELNAKETLPSPF